MREKLGIVGRDDELREVDAFLQAGLEQPTALVLDGEAGIGKTTVWEAGVALARSCGYRVLCSRPSEVERSLPFVSLGDLVEPLLEGSLASLSDPLRRALEVALLQRAPAAEPVERLALWQAVLSILRGLLARAPVLIAIDDVQWIDDATAEAVTFAVRRLGDSPLRVLIAQRSSDGALPLGLEDGPRLQRLRIGPLGVDEIDRLVAGRLDGHLTPRLLAELHRSSGGNPYLALEIVRAVQLRGVPLDSGGALPAPESIAALLRERIALLSEPAVETLLLAACSAQPTASLLELVTGGRACIGELVDAGIVDLDGERLQFTHPLLASVAYSEADLASRRDAHRRLAAAIDDADERALHLARATDRPDAAVAAELDEAAARAHQRGAPVAAGELGDHACRLTPEDRSAELADRIARSAEYHLVAGETARGRALLEQAIDLRRAGPERAGLRLRLGQIGYLDGEVAVAHAEFERALADTGDDAELRARAELALAFTTMFGGDMRGAVAHARASLAVAEALGDPGPLALALGSVVVNEFLCGNGLDRARIERAVLLEEHVGEVPVEWTPSYVHAWLAMFADELARSRELFARLYVSALQRGDELALPTLLFPMSQLEAVAGNWAAARRHADEAVERSMRTGQATLRANALSAQALVHALVGNVDAARAAAANGLEIAQQAGAYAPLAWITAATGFLALSLGDPAAAHAQLGPLSELVVASGLAEPAVVRFLPDEIEALIALGEVDAAAPALLLLEERGLALDRGWARAAAGRCRALWHAARGDHDRARASVAEALAQHARVEQPFELGRTLLVQGQLERRAKRRAAARDALTRALELFDSLGASLWAQKAAAELARIPGRRREPGELSETERRVAELVAGGLSNKEVAGRLFVTVRAVEATLSRVYAKLGVRSRTELVSRLRDPGDV